MNDTTGRARRHPTGAPSAGSPGPGRPCTRRTPKPLHRFIDQGLTDGRLIGANLNYWAYWAGEGGEPWNADSAMTRPPAGTWDGTLLLGTLLRGIVHAPYRDLCAHTLWVLLLLRRPQLTSPKQLPAIKTAVSRALQTGALAPCARQCLEQVSYLTRSA